MEIADGGVRGMNMQRVYTHENLFLVENARNLLAEQGIPGELRNEFAGGGLGELSAFDTWPEVWVAETDYPRARKVIAPLLEPVQGEPWKCEYCDEINESTFGSCWQCGSARIQAT